MFKIFLFLKFDKKLGFLDCYKEKIIAVRGNCDAEVDQMVLEFPILADSTRIYVDGICIFATHGHIYNKGSCSFLQKGDVLLHGHTHVPAAESFGNGNYYINPGSTSIPKENSYKGYIVYQNREFIFKTHGYGHGVGMSQYGADDMAKNGNTWQEIINHYYNDCEITKTE